MASDETMTKLALENMCGGSGMLPQEYGNKGERQV
jgi:hypothetical protein